MKRLAVITALILCVCLMPAHAAEKGDRMLAVKIVKVNPAKMADYEKAMKHAMALYKEHKLDVPAIWVSQNENMNYHLVIPIENHGGLDRLWEVFGEIRKSVGKKAVAEMEAMFADTVESNSVFVTKYMANLSYMPEGFEKRSQDWKYFEMLVWYVKNDAYMDAMQLAGEYRDIYAGAGIEEGFAVYMDYVGPDLPVINVMSWAENPMHMRKMEKAHKKALGDAVKPLHEKFLSMTREVETVRGWFRPDLSYMPDEEPAAEQKAD